MPLSYAGRLALGDTSSYVKGQSGAQSSVKTQIQNARTRLSSVGVDPQPQKNSQNFLLKTLDYLARPGYGANNLIREFTNNQAGSTPGEFDPLSAFWRGIKGEERSTGKEVFTDMGWEGDTGVMGGEAKWYNPSVAGAAGLLLDIFNPLDPLNWLGFGAGDEIAKGTSKGLGALTDAFGTTKASQIADILNATVKTADVVGDVAKAADAASDVSKAAATAVSTVDKLGAKTVGELFAQVANLADTPESLSALRELMEAGAKETGKVATTKLNYSVSRPISVGLQNPLSINTMGSVKLPGYKATGGLAKVPILTPGRDITGTFIDIPGSENITKIVGDITSKIANTSVGQALGKMFSTAFIPNTVPTSVIKRDLTISNLEDLVNISRTRPADVPLSVDELMRLHDELAEIKLGKTFDFSQDLTASRMKNINKGNYFSIDNFARQVKLKDFTTEEVLNLLSDAPFTKSITEIFDELKVLKPIESAEKLFSDAARIRKMMDLMYEQIPEGIKPYFTGVLKPQSTDLFPSEIPSQRLGRNIATSPLMAYEFDYKGVPLSLVVNSGENFNIDSWAKLSATLEALDELPENAIQALQGQIDISPIPLKSPDTSMFLGDDIVLGRIDKPTVAHEFGHAWDSVVNDPDSYSRAILQDASKIDNVITEDDLYSDYARSLYSTNNAVGLKEDFANSVSDYLRDRAGFRSQYPARAAEIERVLDSVQTSPEDLAKLVSQQRTRAEQLANVPKSEDQIRQMIDSVDQYATKLDWSSGDKTYQTFRENLSSLYEQTNWKTKQWKQQVDELFRGIDEEGRKQIMDAAAQITGTEIPGRAKSMAQPLFSQQDYPVFASKLQSVVDDMPNKMSTDQFKNYLKNKGVKAEELKWTFMDDFFEGKTSITKAEAQDWVRGNQLEVREVWRTDSSPQASKIRAAIEENGTTWEQVQQGIDEMRAGGDSDQIIIAQLQEAFEVSYQDAQAMLQGNIDMTDIRPGEAKTKYPQYTQLGGEDYMELEFVLPHNYGTPRQTGDAATDIANQFFSRDPGFQSSHWEEPNVVAHARFDTRYDDQGRKVLFLEEIQSDWHQAGRDYGYKVSLDSIPESEREKIRLSIMEAIEKNDYFGFDTMSQALDALTHDGYESFARIFEIEPGTEKALQDYINFRRQVNPGPNAVPDAPFRGNWDEYVQKRLLRYAADNGYDGIAWTTGTQQAKRYNQPLTEAIDTLQYNQTGHSLRAYKEGQEVFIETIPPERLSDYVGSDIARRLLSEDPDTFTVQPVAKNPGTEHLIDRVPEGMDAAEVIRWMNQQPEFQALRPIDGTMGEPQGYQVVDQNGNTWGYIYHTEEAALKAINDLAIADQRVKTVSGTNITIGSEGMRNFYDQQIPSNFKKLGKKFGLSVEEIPLDFQGQDGRKFIQDLGEAWENDELFDLFRGPIDPESFIDQAYRDLTTYFQPSRGLFEQNSISRTDFNEAIDQYIRGAQELANSEPVWAGVDLSSYRDRIYRSVEYDLPIPIDNRQSISKQQGIWLSPDARHKITQQSFPLYTDGLKTPVDSLTEGWSDNQVAALDNFLKWRNSVVKQYRQMGIPINELEKYVPFIPQRVLRTEEADLLRARFGTGVQDATADNFDILMSELSKADPNLKPRTTQATRPSKVNELLRKPWLTEDAAVAMSIRGSRAIKAQELSTFADEFIQSYGMRAQDLAEMASNTVPEGYAAYKVGKDAAGNKILQQVHNLTQGAMDGLDTIFLPKEMAELYNNYSSLITGGEYRNGLLKMYDDISRVYKKAAYLWNPGHILRDLQGNVFNNYLMGVTDPMEYAEGLRVVRGAEGALITPNGELPYKEIKEQAEKLGIIDSVIAHEIPLSIAKEEKGYSKMMRKATYATDGWTRSTGFIHNLKQGQSYAEAATNTKKYLFDYFDLTPFERKTMKRIIPFYTWMRKNIPLQLKTLVTDPRIFARINDIMNSVHGGVIDWENEPKYVQDSLAIQPLGSDKYLRGSLPYQDLTKIPTGIDEDSFRNFLSSVNPLIRAPIESVTNQKWWTGQELEQYPGEQEDIPVLSRLMEMLGTENTPTVDRRYTGNLLDQIPVLGRADNLLNTFSGAETNDARNLSRLSTTLGGPAFYDASSVRNSADWQERQRLIDLIRLLQDQGMEIPSVNQIQKETRYQRMKRLLSGR